MNIKKELINTARNSIRLKIGGAVENAALGGTRFGGAPDVPEGFEWDYFESESLYDSTVKSRPLTFLAQFDLEEITRFDTENLLPKTGVLSFFYELESQCWGYDPKDKGSARVHWFEDKNALHTADFPEDLGKNEVGFDYRLPTLKITAQSELSYQSFEDFLLQRDKMIEQWDEFNEVEHALGVSTPSESSKMLGWADPIQGNMTRQCELVSRGYYLGGTLEEVTPRDRQEAEQWANRDWLLLLQLDSALDFDSDYELPFGDCGRIYFYIRREDLAAGNFDNVWTILQCT